MRSLMQPLLGAKCAISRAMFDLQVHAATLVACLLPHPFRSNLAPSANAGLVIACALG